MKARNAVRLGALLAAIAAGAAACQLVAGLDGDYVAAPIPDGGTDAGADAGEGGSPGCASATYPDPPAIADDGASTEIVLAMRTIDLGESAVVPPGYDLDHVCTCFADAGPSCASSKPHCDAPGGIDSASAQFFSLIKFAAGASNFSSESYSARIGEGLWSLIVRVRGYNGEPDDPKVDVALYPSPGVEPPPSWNGDDAWAIALQSVNADDVDQPVYTSDGAYVAQGTLVAALPTVLMKLGGSEDTITFKLTGGVLTGKLVQGANGWSLTGGVLAARWKIDDIFQALSTYRDGNGAPLCTDAVIAYDSAKSAICNGLDILADPTGAKNLPCDALSIGVGFTAQQAKLGPVDVPPMLSPGCPPESDPANDSCPSN